MTLAWNKIMLYSLVMAVIMFFVTYRIRILRFMVSDSGEKAIVETADKAIERFTKWVAGQSFNNVLLLAILASNIAFGTYLAMYAIPQYEEAHRQERKDIQKANADDRKDIRLMYDKWIDNITSAKYGRPAQESVLEN